jgi:hypothetical protein
MHIEQLGAKLREEMSPGIVAAASVNNQLFPHMANGHHCQKRFPPSCESLALRSMKLDYEVCFFASRYMWFPWCLRPYQSLLLIIA